MTDREVIMQQALTALVAMQMEAAHRNCRLKIADDSTIALRAAIAQEPEWVDDPHDIEQGMMRNPKWKPATNIAQPKQLAPVRQPLAPDEIQTIALENGFKLKEQPDGAMRLNPYVFDFVSAIESAHGIAQPKDKP